MIQETTVSEIKNYLLEQTLDDQLVGQLREKWPSVHFTYCSDDDIHAGKPVEEAKDFYLYLVNSSDHCLCLTNDYEQASGLVIAERFDDED